MGSSRSAAIHAFAKSIVEVSWWPAAVVVILLAALWFDQSGLGQYDPFYDSGVYLESARMMRRGYAAYRVVFSSQPPLWLPLVRVAFFLFGESFLAGQLLSAAANLITIGAVMAAVAQLQDRVSAVFAALIVILAPVELGWSRSVIADVPSTAFAAAALALAVRYFRLGSRVCLVLAAITIAVSVLIKLFGFYTVPAILVLVAARWANKPELDRRARLDGFAKDLLILGAIPAAMILLLVCTIDVPKAWDGVVTFHLHARVSGGSGDGWQILLNFLPRNGPLEIIVGMSGLCLLGGWRGLPLLTWMLCTLLGLLQHRPLFTHHLIALIPATAAAAAFGFGEVARRWLNYWSRRETPPAHALALFGRASCGLLGLFVIAKLWTTARANDYFQQITGSQSEAAVIDRAAARELQRLTRPDMAVLTDAQGIAFLADRDVPPGLTDTSFTRIAAGYLSADEVIDQSQRIHVRVALLWTGRLSQMPEVVAWVKNHFSRRERFGEGHDLYFLP